MFPSVQLVPYRKEYLGPFIEWRKQSPTVQHNPLLPLNDDEIEKMLNEQGSDLSDLRKYSTYRWFVEFEGNAVGSVSLKNISHSMGYAEIGFGLSEAYHARGIGTAAVTLLVHKVFDETQLRKLIAYVRDKNLPSCRLLKKLGFQQEGFLREHYIINGRPENEVVFGLLKRDWAV